MEPLLKALVKAQTLRRGHRRHMAQKSVYSLLFFFCPRKALTQQSVSDVKIQLLGETSHERKSK